MDTAVVRAVWYDIHRAVGVIAVIVDSPLLLYDDWIHFRQEDTIDLKVLYQYIRYYFLKPTRCGGIVNQNTAEIEHAPSSTYGSIYPTGRTFSSKFTFRHFANSKFAQFDSTSYQMCICSCAPATIQSGFLQISH